MNYTAEQREQARKRIEAMTRKVADRVRADFYRWERDLERKRKNVLYRAWESLRDNVAL